MTEINQPHENAETMIKGSPEPRVVPSIPQLVGDAQAVREPAPEPADYFALFRSIKAGEKLQILKSLGVDESDLAEIGTPQLLAVVWKHLQNTTGAVKMRDLLDLTEDELLSKLSLSEAGLMDQVHAYLESQPKS